MSDKLQEIKDRIDDIMMHGKERRSAQLQLMYANGEIEWLIEQLEQAQAELKRIDECYQDACDEIAKLEAEKEQLSKQFEECMGSHERLEAACHRLKKDKHKLHAVHDENYAKAAHRAGVIEELQAANQKLVECLERIEGCTMSMFSTSENMSIYMISLAQQALSEVKGNG